MLYATTSRKPSAPTKRLCRLLCSLFPSASYENRGKKSVEEVVGRARSLGCSRILVFAEEHGTPRSIRFIDIGNEWSWDPREIKIGPLVLGEKTKTPRAIRLAGANSKLFSELFQIENEKTDENDEKDRIALNAGQKKISFEYSKKLLLSFNFEVVTHGQDEV